MEYLAAERHTEGRSNQCRDGRWGKRDRTPAWLTDSGTGRSSGNRGNTVDAGYLQRAGHSVATANQRNEVARFALVSVVRGHAISNGAADAEHADAGCRIDHDYCPGQQRCAEGCDARIGAECFRGAPERL